MITQEDIIKIRKADWETCEAWYTTLNSWKWPDELLPEESPKVKCNGSSRRILLMNCINKKVGEKYLLRIHNLRRGMTEEEYEDFWNGHHENDIEAFNRSMIALDKRIKKDKLLK